MDSIYGLGWSKGLLGTQPIWTVEPSVEIISEIAYRHLKLSQDDINHSTTKFQFQGAFNRLYAVECPRGSYFMRITLPVHPHFKTSSEVATIALLRSHTSVPVPHIIASSSTTDNELKFEWILMERIHGVPLADIWASLAWDAKVSCVMEVACIMAQIFELRYNSIGNLFNAKDLPEEPGRTVENNTTKSDFVVLDRIVSMTFFWDTHLKSDVHQGPFASSKNWLEARFQLMEEDCRRVLESQDADEDEIEDMEEAQQQLKRLRKQLPLFFPSNADDREEFALHHDDISRHNLIFDSNGKLQALVDWECVSVLPLWKACQIPYFLRSLERIKRPNPARYSSDPDDGGDSLYAEHLNDFECTYLRGKFLEEMARLSPRWIEEYEKSKSKMDFERALEMCDGLFVRRVSMWLDHIEAGERHYRLRDD